MPLCHATTALVNNNNKDVHLNHAVTMPLTLQYGLLDTDGCYFTESNTDN